LAKITQVEIARKVVKQGLSVRATESLVQQLSNKDKPAKAKKTARDPNISKLENDLSEKLGTSVAINHQANGRGKLEIHYNSLDELDGLLNHIK